MTPSGAAAVTAKFLVAGHRLEVVRSQIAVLRQKVFTADNTVIGQCSGVSWLDLG